MAVVTISITPNSVVIDPATVVINRIDQQITWKLQGGTWEGPGVAFNPASANNDAWPGTQPTPDGNGDLVATAQAKMPDGTTKHYSYTITARDTTGNLLNSVVSMGSPSYTNYGPETVNLVPGSGFIEIDPGVENQPTP